MAIVANNNTFPTKFAIMVATSCGLFIPDHGAAGREEEWYDLRDRLAEFQKLSMSSDFETCMIAYYGHELSEFQVEKLQFIYEKTKSWLFGEVAEHVFTSIQKTTGKEAKELTELFLENFIKNKADAKTKKSLLVRFANVDPSEVTIEEETEIDTQEGDDNNE